MKFSDLLVHSMLETPDHPTLSRVMRVQPRSDEKPADGFSWGDYEDVREAGAEADADDEGWGVVKSKSEFFLYPFFLPLALVWRLPLIFIRTIFHCPPHLSFNESFFFP